MGARFLDIDPGSNQRGWAGSKSSQIALTLPSHSEVVHHDERTKPFGRIAITAHLIAEGHAWVRHGAI